MRVSKCGYDWHTWLVIFLFYSYLPKCNCAYSTYSARITNAVSHYTLSFVINKIFAYSSVKHLLFVRSQQLRHCSNSWLLMSCNQIRIGFLRLILGDSNIKIQRRLMMCFDIWHTGLIYRERRFHYFISFYFLGVVEVIPKTNILFISGWFVATEKQ